MYKLRAEILEKVKSNSRLKTEIAYNAQVSAHTVDRWLRENHSFITMYGVLETISQHYSQPINDLIFTTHKQAQNELN